jgi:hypothetical protein
MGQMNFAARLFWRLSERYVGRMKEALSWPVVAASNFLLVANKKYPCWGIF